MKYFLLVILCSASISASAQWWQKPVNTITNVFKKHERFPQIDEVKDHSIKGLPVAQLAKHKISNINLELASYSLYLKEIAVIKIAQFLLLLYISSWF